MFIFKITLNFSIVIDNFPEKCTLEYINPAWAPNLIMENLQFLLTLGKKHKFVN